MTRTSSDTSNQVRNASEQRSLYDLNEAVFSTSAGEFVVRLDHDGAPFTVTNFIKLAQDGFYDGQRFHRVIEGFMIQGGDPLSKDESKKDQWGTGGPGYKFKDEFGPGLSNVPGTISMANAGPNTNGSQFFINVNDNSSYLDGKHAVFGKVISGMDVVTKISLVKRDSRDRPIDDVLITSVVVR